MGRHPKTFTAPDMASRLFAEHLPNFPESRPAANNRGIEPGAGVCSFCKAALPMQEPLVPC
jgi:hypothetical protein